MKRTKEYNYNKLRGKIREVCGKEGEFADLIGISKVSLSNKLRNKVEWTQDEIYAAVGVLKIDADSVYTYFFTPKS